MNVQIIEISTGKLVSVYPIFAGGENYTSSDQEYFDLAWRCAVEDKLVQPEDREKYSFHPA